MVINTNTTSLFARRTLEASNMALGKSLARLSSGSKIVSPEDDAAGLAVSMKFRAEIARVGSASANVGNAISFSQTQDGFLGTVDTALRRMSELAVLAADQTKSNSDVENYQKEFSELKEFISRTAGKTFNGVGLFSSATLEDKDLSSVDDVARNSRYDALLKTQVDTTLKAAYDAFIAAPDGLADDVTFKAGTVTAKKAAGGADGYFTLAAGHGIDNGQRVRFYDASVATGISTTVDYYLKVDAANANKFTIHTDAALTSAAVDPVADDAAKLHMMSYGNYDKLKTLRTELANTAMEWEQKELATVDRTKQDWSGATVDSVKQVDTITIAGDATGAADTFNVTINGNTLATAVSYDGASINSTATALATAINADATLSALVDATTTGASGVVTLTSTVGGNAFTTEAAVTQGGGGGVTASAVVLNDGSGASVLNVTGVDASKTVTKSWQDVYDFWQTRTGNTWSGVRAHVDAVDRQAKDIVNQGSLTDDLATQYKNMYSDIKSYIYNNGAGIAVTDRSDGGSYQLKGADVSFITDAIDNSTDTYAIKEDLTKTNGETYAKNVSSLINDLAGTRAYVGANISRLNMVNSQLAVYGENLGAANSRIADVDVAVESANYAKNQILVQSGTAMLAQANVLPQYALQLLQ